jgi:transmembrane sensor
MIDLDARLARGSLRVRNLWSPRSVEVVALRILRRRRLFVAVDMVAVCACLALAVFGLRSARPVSSASPSVARAAMVTTFSDGSVAEASSRDTDLQVVEDSAEHVVTRLKGSARFRVVPNHRRTFEVRAGDVRVRVLGTIFSVEQLPSGQTQVLVERGRVEVAWLGGATLLESGQGSAFPPASGAQSEVELAPTATIVSTAAVPPASSARGAASQHSPGASGRGWREDAKAGDYGRAYDELRARGRDAVSEDVGDLMLAADVARLSAHPEDAVQPLRSVCDRHSSDRRAPVAAFTLGRVLVDDLGRSTEAAAAFQLARVLWPAGPLAEDALAREADAWERAGRPEGARGAASQYLARYPQGRHASTMREILTH